MNNKLSNQTSFQPAGMKIIHVIDYVLHIIGKVLEGFKYAIASTLVFIKFLLQLILSMVRYAHNKIVNGACFIEQQTNFYELKFGNWIYHQAHDYFTVEE